MEKEAKKRFTTEYGKCFMAWRILSPKDIEKPWFGSLGKYAVEKSHDMKDIRRSIAQKHKTGSSSTPF